MIFEQYLKSGVKSVRISIKGQKAQKGERALKQKKALKVKKACSKPRKSSVKEYFCILMK